MKFRYGKTNRLKKERYFSRQGRFNRDYSVVYEKFGICCVCREEKNVSYSKILPGWRCENCQPGMETKNFMIKKAFLWRRR